MALRAFRSNPSIGGFGGESLASRPRPPRPPPGRGDAADVVGAAAAASSASSSSRRAVACAGGAAAWRSSAAAGGGGGGGGGSSCGDAFAQIVKELVDNAVDACAASLLFESGAPPNDGTTTRRRRRVRVTITPATVPSSSATGGGGTSDDDDDDDDDDNGDSFGGGGEGLVISSEGGRGGGRSCLRIEVSDNGCGMSDIDYCVSAFGSTKNGTTTTTTTKGGGGERRRRKTDKDKLAIVEKTKKNAKMGENDKNQISSSSRMMHPLAASPDDGDGGDDGHGDNCCTSGRYGIGLTLCLLHAQRLVPGTGACVTSATSDDDEWTRGTYEPDADADVVVCKRREKFTKNVVGESGTTVSLLVPVSGWHFRSLARRCITRGVFGMCLSAPFSSVACFLFLHIVQGGEDARMAWPRLAEYFARFRLVTNLPCSLEVKAPTLQPMPLYIRPPPGEMERRAMDRAASGGEDEENSNNRASNNWDGGDGFDEEGISVDPDRAPKISKAAQKRAEADVRRKEKLSLICKAAVAYKRRPDLKVENVAYSVQPIRRDYTGSRQSSSPSQQSGPVLEMSLIVFGPDPGDADDHGDDGSENGSYPRDDDHRCNKKTSSELQVVRMVNGIPLLDSSEALACGVINKVTSNSDTWNTFGLNVSRKSENDQGPVPSNELNTPTFVINDSAQVAPFLMSTTHSLFRDQSRDRDQSSSDDDESDTENRRGKRKKARQVQCLLPAALRLGDILMVVQIRAKPSALPLPTLSKVSFVATLSMSYLGCLNALRLEI